MAGRRISTIDGLDPAVRQRLIGAFVDHGASQCGFCTPGIIVRLAALGPDLTPDRVRSALLAHLCRCTGWQSIVDAACSAPALRPRSLDVAAQQAALEGGVGQDVGPSVVAGGGGFAADTAPTGALVAAPDRAGTWHTAPTVRQARALAGKVQGRRSGHQVHHPVAVPPGDWALTLQTTWVEPGYLEPDASWCAPGGEPASPLANGGAFGAKDHSPVPAAARRLADEQGRPVLAMLSREDVVRTGAKRPPVGAGVRSDGTGVIRVARTPGIVAAVAAVAPAGLVVEEVDAAGPPTSAALRAAGWAEAAVLMAAARARAAGDPMAGSGRAEVAAPGGGRAVATVTVDEDGRPCDVAVTVAPGAVLDEVVLRSYVLGAAHMALGWVCTEALAVDDAGVPQDLTIRSWGILRAKDLPPVAVVLEEGAVDEGAGEPCPVSDAAFAAVAAACWIAQGLPPQWPTIRGRYR